MNQVRKSIAGTRSEQARAVDLRDGYPYPFIELLAVSCEPSAL